MKYLTAKITYKYQAILILHLSLFQSIYVGTGGVTRDLPGFGNYWSWFWIPLHFVPPKFYFSGPAYSRQEVSTSPRSPPPAAQSFTNHRWEGSVWSPSLCHTLKELRGLSPCCDPAALNSAAWSGHCLIRPLFPALASSSCLSSHSSPALHVPGTTSQINHPH